MGIFFRGKMATEKTRSEDILGEKWDRCLADSLIKTASGVGLGIVFSVALFKRRPWPVAFGAGTGFGMAYSNCQNDFRSPHLFHGQIKEAGK